MSSRSGLRQRGTAASEVSAAGSTSRPSATQSGSASSGERHEGSENFRGVGTDAETPKESTPLNR